MNFLPRQQTTRMNIMAEDAYFFLNKPWQTMILFIIRIWLNEGKRDLSYPSQIYWIWLKLDWIISSKFLNFIEYSILKSLYPISWLVSEITLSGFSQSVWHTHKRANLQVVRCILPYIWINRDTEQVQQMEQPSIEGFVGKCWEGKRACLLLAVHMRSSTICTHWRTQNFNKKWDAFFHSTCHWYV